MDKLKNAILSTITYFNLFDYPLTSWEVWKLLYRNNASYYDVAQALDFLAGNGPLVSSLNRKHAQQLQSSRGFYFFRGRESLVETRLVRQRISIFKYKRAKRIGRFLAAMPFVRMIGVINTLSYNNATRESDIDLIIVTDAGLLWTARFFTVSFLKLFRLRPHDNNRSDKICLNMFLARSDMNLEKVALKPRDIHFAHIISYMFPLYDEGEYYKKYIGDNTWVRSYFPHFFFCSLSRVRSFRLGRLGRFLKALGENLQPPAISPLTESFFYLLQHIMMPEALKISANKTSNVVLDKTLLKFHLNDRRAYYNQKFEQQLERQLLIKV